MDDENIRTIKYFLLKACIGNISQNVHNVTLDVLPKCLGTTNDLRGTDVGGRTNNSNERSEGTRQDPGGGPIVYSCL